MSGDSRAKFIDTQLSKAEAKGISQIFVFFILHENIFIFFGIKDKRLVILSSSEDIFAPLPDEIESLLNIPKEELSLFITNQVAKDYLLKMPGRLATAYEEIATDETDSNIPPYNPYCTYFHSTYLRERFVKRAYVKISDTFHIFYGILKNANK